MRKIRFRSIVLFMAVALFLAINAAGGRTFAEEKKEPAEKPELTIWTGFEEKEQDTLKIIAHKFSAEKNVNIWVIQTPFYELREKLKDAKEDGKSPDLFICPNDWIGDLAENRLITPLSEDEFPASLQEKFNETGIRGLTYKGKIYGMPFFMETTAILYNKKLVKQLPSTMDELLKQASDYNNPSEDRFGFLFEADNFYILWPFFSGFYAEIFPDGKGGVNEGEVLLDSENSLKALEYLEDMGLKYGLIDKPRNNEEIDGLFIEGKVMYCLQGPWAVKRYRRSMVNYGVLEFPKLPNGEVPKPFVGVYAFLITPHCDNRKLAVDFLNYLNSPDNQKAFCTIDNRIPGRKDVLSDIIKEHSEIITFAKIAEKGIPIPNTPAMSAVWPAMSSVLKSVIIDDSPPEIQLKKGVKEINQKISNMKN